ncbi:MAG: CBS domain-containing protein [Chloroflexi bacterium]|nr:CBS domain-containing protein [Chloroflexota bacterium]MBK6709529.1 CBS domain-containing protein [Chloroflexota bacterium]MBK7180317.1 CBS domain-containing protein [Chloroflexota bacterium]MBK7915292.1 CBS domain-containing protein [Chloroflexota bacterium]MBK8934222.1 CBS domain-containing protein [Chloroflexota bacterium]
MKQELVRDWMTKDVIRISPETTLPKAHEMMTENNIRRLPVVDDENRLIGIVTLGDVRGAEPSQATSLSMWELNYLLTTVCIEELMTKNPVTIGQDATIGEAARLMLDYRISGLPVTNQLGKLVGVITESDIFRMVVRHQWDKDAVAA